MLLPASSYPIRGIIYFTTHPVLWGRCLCALLILLIVALLSLGGGFTAMPFIAHALIRANCPDGLAWVVSVIFALLISALAVLITVLIIMPTLASTLVTYVWEQRGIPYNDNLDTLIRGCAADCGVMLIQRLLGIVVLLVTFPLNAIPVAGTVLFCYLNGWIYAWEQQTRYHVEVKGWDYTQSRKYAIRHRQSYASFGFVCYLLHLVPVANILFSFTNAVGAALWSADQWDEEQKRLTKSRGLADASPSTETTQMREQGIPHGGSSTAIDVLDIQEAEENKKS